MVETGPTTEIESTQNACLTERIAFIFTLGLKYYDNSLDKFRVLINKLQEMNY